MLIQNHVDDIIQLERQIESAKNHQKFSLLLFPIIIGIPMYFRAKRSVTTLQKKRVDIYTGIRAVGNVYFHHTQEIEDTIKRKETYLVSKDKLNYIEILDGYLKDIGTTIKNKNSFPGPFIQNILVLGNLINKQKTSINEYNEIFIQDRIQAYQYLFQKSKHPLDPNQKRAVVTDDTHNLVVAGAGSGKTEVLINRIAYLLERQPDIIKPERILVLAYQNKAANEIKERLHSQFGHEVKVKTFHSLGKEIHEQACEEYHIKSPELMFSGDNFDMQYSAEIQRLFKIAEKSPSFQNLILNFMHYYGDADPEKNQSDFTSKQEFYEYLSGLSYIALNETKVKSEAEREILNFLYTHQINGYDIQVLYESPAYWMHYTDSKGKKQVPKPDFFLPQSDIYIEHWAIDENNRVPEWFSGENPTQDYLKGMYAKKQKFFEQKKYRLVETTQAEFFKNKAGFTDILKSRLILQLKAQFPGEEFIIEKLPFDKILNKSWKDCKESVGTLPDHIGTFIRIAKTYALTPDAIGARLINERWSKRQKSFAELANIIFRDYENMLQEHNVIDFSDMINNAVTSLNRNEGFYKDRYDQILVDEYQDISYQRYLLVQAIMQKSENCKLFCVGDDWQGIMGFTGADLDLFVRFYDFFDNPARTDLGINYRSVESIVDTGAAIISNNGSIQIQKATQASKPGGDKISVFRFNFDKSQSYEYDNQVALHCTGLIENFLTAGYKPEEIMILSRIVKRQHRNQKLMDYAKQKGIPLSLFSQRPNNVSLISVHKSKGLQARIVIILNVDHDLYGFPCELHNPDVYAPATMGIKKDHWAEERRLFYVAVTRAKEKIIIYSSKPSMSRFLEEIKEHLDIVDVK